MGLVAARFRAGPIPTLRSLWHGPSVGRGGVFLFYILGYILPMHFREAFYILGYIPAPAFLAALYILGYILPVYSSAA